MIRKATINDIMPIMGAVERYHNESMNSDRVLCADRFYQTIVNAVTQEGWTTLLSMEDDKIAGVLIAYENYSFFEDDEMDIDFFYILPEYRGKGVARKLVGEIKELALSKNIAIMYCGCHSNMNDAGRNDKLFTNLFKKYGFEETGMNLHLKLKG